MADAACSHTSWKSPNEESKHLGTFPAIANVFPQSRRSIALSHSILLGSYFVDRQRIVALIFPHRQGMAIGLGSPFALFFRGIEHDSIKLAQRTPTSAPHTSWRIRAALTPPPPMAATMGCPECLDDWHSATRWWGGGTG